MLDFEFWGPGRASSVRWLAREQGVRGQIWYVPVGRKTEIERVRQRWEPAPHQTFPVTVEESDRWRDQFEVPTEDELAGGVIGPSADEGGWLAWAQNRWPSLSMA